MLQVRLLPLDDGVLVSTTTLEDVEVIIINQRDKSEVLVAPAPQYASSSYITRQDFVFVSEKDGTYLVTIGDESRVVLVNNKTLLLLEHVRSSILRKENVYSLDVYRLLLALNYTAIDNWRIGEYSITHDIYTYLAEFTLLHNDKLNQLLDY